ncbi:succinyl-CoA synthetase subunit beta [uncultured Tateyamaria sp.]|uniref:succinyl-CoA synthetase subunit beta n=1 Tax=uncultured Tateyamaria sp. TaxID=455651 RepID=UPI00261C6A12|nr:succinyl-CoA synthetase subunit beta [uncultured Tateyamaria sp.]
MLTFALTPAAGHVNTLWRRIAQGVAVLCAIGGATNATADSDPALAAFRDMCFSPFLTAATARAAFDLPGVRAEFYDLDPFSNVAPSLVTGRAATPGTDRRCEVAFDGVRLQDAYLAVAQAVEVERLDRKVPVPPEFVVQSGAFLVDARQLNPNRIAVVQVGLRPGPNGQETFLSVERLNPLSDQN